jgi:hypothetical protein
MKITEAHVREIIKEEIHNVLNEGDKSNKAAMVVAAVLGISYLSAIDWLHDHHNEARQVQQLVQDGANALRGVMGQEPLNIMPPERNK